MPRGGARPGAGRPKGSKSRYHISADKFTHKSRAHQAEANQYLQTFGREPFGGDSVAFLASVYKDQELPLNVRMIAASGAAPFERPRMNDQRILILETAEKQKATQT